MPRTYGTTNVAPYATAPAVGPAGDTYYNTGNKALYISDGTAWNAIQAGGGGGGAPYAPVTGTAPPPSTPTITPPTGLLWVDTATTPSWVPSAGPGVPAGGTTGQYLRKRTNTDYDTQWFGPANLIFYQTIPALTPAMSPYVIPHNLGTQYVHVQMWDSVTGLLVQAQVQIVNVNSIQISVTQAMPNAVNVVVVGTPNLATPVNPADIASKSYVDSSTDKGLLSAAVDLNSAVTPGAYQAAGGNPNQPPIPTGPFVLEVQSASGVVQQRATLISSPNYIATRENSGGWQPWKSPAAGLIASGTGPPAQVVNNGTVWTWNTGVTVIPSRRYRHHLWFNYVSTTTASTFMYFVIQEPLATWWAPGQRVWWIGATTNAGQTNNGSATRLYLPTSSGVPTFILSNNSSINTATVNANACEMALEDLGV